MEKPPQLFEGDHIYVDKIGFFDKPKHYKSEEDLKLHNEVLESTVKKLETGKVLLARSYFTDVLEDSSLTGIFTEDENLSKGKEESRNGILFGQLLLKSFFDQAKTQIVAVKPLISTAVAVHEFGVSEYLNGFGKSNRPKLTYQPMGFWKDKDGTTMLITRYEDSVVSFDGLFWKGLDEDFTPLKIDRAVGRCLFALGTLHNLGLIHEDAQIKNLATDNNGIRFIDLEEARTFSKNKNGQHNTDDAWKGMMRDLHMFAGSLIQRINRLNNPEQAIDHIRRSLIEKAHIYAAATNLPTSRVPEISRLNTDDTIEQLIDGIDLV